MAGGRLGDAGGHDALANHGQVGRGVAQGGQHPAGQVAAQGFVPAVNGDEAGIVKQGGGAQQGQVVGVGNAFGSSYFLALGHHVEGVVQAVVVERRREVFAQLLRDVSFGLSNIHGAGAGIGGTK